ncbi:44499_t:CDS:1, partial [Gigaspora margarita]
MSQNFEPIETNQIAIRLIIIRLNHVLFYFSTNFCPITRIEEDENIINELLREFNTCRNFDSLTNISHKIYLVLNQ